MNKDQVTLVVPSAGEYARTVRMTAAELASKAGMTYDKVDDVRIAAEEAFVFACDCCGADASVTFVFTLSDGELTIDVGPLAGCDFEAQAQSVSEGYAAFILQSVCDEFSIDHTPEGGLIHLVHYATQKAEDASV